MKKTVLTAATATLTAGLIGLAAVASAGGPSSSGTGEVSSTSPAATSQPVRGGADDPVPHDVGDDHGSAGHGADDVPAPTPADVPLPTPVATPAPAAVPAPASGGRHGADDPVSHDVGDDHAVDDPATHDVGDDHGDGRHGADDPATHDAGDDHGSGGHGADD